MSAERERLMYVAVDTRGNCRPVNQAPDGNSNPFSGAIGYLGQLLEEGWQLVSESSPPRSESSIVLLKRNR